MTLSWECVGEGGEVDPIAFATSCLYKNEGKVARGKSGMIFV